MDRLTRDEVFGRGGYPAGAARYRVEGAVAVHSHDFVEVAVIVAGTGRYDSRLGATPLAPGSVLAVRPGQWHGYRECRSVEVYNLYLGPELLRRELLWCLDFPDLARFLLRGGRARTPLPEERLAAVVGWLAELSGRRTKCASAEAPVSLGLLCCALGELAGLAFDEESDRGTFAPAVRGALQLMSEDPARPWRMTELAARSAVSPAHLHRQFRAALGTSPMEWLGRSRAELAAALLIQGGRPVAEIARRVGWPDPNYFSRRFREYHGMSPTGYRRRFRTS